MVSVTTDARREFLAAIEKRYGRSLRRFLAQRMHHSAADVPDLVQEVFLRLLRVSDHDAIQNPQAYLYTVASHVLHQHGIRRSVAPELVELPEEILDLEPDLETDPAVALELEERYLAVGEALKQRSPNAYATLLMHRRDGMPLKEVALHLHVSYSMAKRYLATALAYIQQNLRETE